MSNYGKASESTGFFSKIRENYSNKFSNLSLTASHPEKDGNTEDDTLIHKAFVRYFDEKREPYPDWLGVKVPDQPQTNGRRQDRFSEVTSEFQPIYHNNQFNSNYNQPHTRRSLPERSQSFDINEQNQGNTQLSPLRPSYQPRSSSRLQDLYNKSRQQSIPGSGYNTQPYQPSPARSNSYSTTGSRLRERLLNNPTQFTQTSSSSSAGSNGASKATWGKK
ncbi:uncharacterized protein PRCAT00002896001 [Priceomyces carsonii]|uniref:uncharacterized protein n=1 Tax=Priceomyces carsonii TaxID=28549 RepID=UPI002ED882AC|nr:unnamed protein product [Priceomyces carsonii]